MLDSAAIVDAHRAALVATAQLHLAAVLQQLLEAERVQRAEAWRPVLQELAVVAARSLAPAATAAHGRMDPNFYIKVKRISEAGQPGDSCVVQGVVCRRNVTHRRMRTLVQSPRVLLLGGSLEYQRVASKLSSFDSLREQEAEHLRLAVSRVASVAPDVVLVERSVARAAQVRLKYCLLLLSLYHYTYYTMLC